MADPPIPNWDNFPILDGKGNEAEIAKKGNVDYVNYHKVLRTLRQLAKGWVPGFRTWVDADGIEQRVYPEKDGSGSVVVFFRAPTGSGFMDTEDYCQPIISPRNQALPVEKVSSLQITNAIKRGWCAAAATHFGLYSEIWSKDPLEDPYLNEDLQAKSALKPSTAAKRNPPAQSNVDTSDKAGELHDLRGIVSAAMQAVYDVKPKIAADWAAAFKKQFPKHGADQPRIQALNKEQLVFSHEYIDNYK